MPATPPAVAKLSACLESELFAAIAEPKRVAIIRRLLLLGGGGDVTTIAAGVAVDRSVVSRHLAVLERAGVVSATKIGRQRVYRLAAGGLITELEELLHAVRAAVVACCPAAPLADAPSPDRRSR